MLKEAIEAATSELSAAEIATGLRVSARGPVGHGKLALALEALLCNLLVVWLLDPGRELAVPLDHNAVFSKANSKVRVYGQHFLDAVQLLTREESGLATVLSKGFKVGAARSQLTALAAAPALLDRFGPAMADGLAAFSREPSADVLVLKATKAKGAASHPLPFRETTRTAQLRREVHMLNAWLEAADVALPLAALRSLNARSAAFVDPTCRTVRRIFNNGKWTEGGRLYGAFWETMPRADRFAFLRIEGEAPANVDYGQLFLRLAYMRAGIQAPQGDLYGVFPDGAARSGFKRLINAMLFSEGRLKNWPDGSRALFPSATKLVDVIAAIEAFHSPIAMMFGTGIGHQLAFIESCLLLEV